MWRLRAPDGARSVVLGTMHVTDPRVLAISEIAHDELIRSERFVMEVILDGAAAQGLHKAMYYGDGQTLRETVGAALYERTVEAMQGYGVPATLVNAMKPWAAFITLSAPAASGARPLDMMLMDAARASGKTVTGLETVAEQIGVFEALSERDQVEMLREIACHHEVFQDDIETMIAHYVARDLQSLLALSLQHTDASRDAFLDALLWQRNQRMVERLLPLLARGGTFVAIGALHLAGPRGLLELLEARGYQVEAIY